MKVIQICLCFIILLTTLGQQAESRSNYRITTELNTGMEDCNFTVSDKPWFKRRLNELNRPNHCANGGTITLNTGIYDILSVAKFKKPLHIQGSGQGANGTVLRGLNIIDPNKRIIVTNLRIESSHRGPAVMSVVGSKTLTQIEDVTFRNANLVLGRENQVNKVNLFTSDLSFCAGVEGRIRKYKDNRCIYIKGSGRTLIGGTTSSLGNTFHDCLDCDFIHGHGSNVTIQNNTFENARPSNRCQVCLNNPNNKVCGTDKTDCNHNDYIQIQGGSNWTIKDNEFSGERTYGAAMVALELAVGKPEMSGIFIDHNVFDHNGQTRLSAIFVNRDRNDRTPKRVEITANCILSEVRLSSIILNTPSTGEGKPCEDYPWIDGNDIRFMATQNGGYCDNARWGEHNRIRDGLNCPATLPSCTHVPVPLRNNCQPPPPP